MRIGLLADLHFGIDPWVDRQVERFIEARVGPAACDGLLIAGDVAEMAGLVGADLGRRHRSLLARLKTVVAGPVGFCAGNHDLWSSDARSTPGGSTKRCWRRLPRAPGRSIWMPRT